MIRDRAAAEGRLESDSTLNILAPSGFLPKELLLEFQKRERVQVVLHEEPFPSALLRRALKASPGQFDAVIVYHYQVSALRNERRLISLYDSRVKFPTNIAPDFRKLPDDRNLMDTAPLQWGLLGLATKATDPVTGARPTVLRFGFWPSTLIGGEASDVPTQNFVTLLRTSIDDLNSKNEKRGLTHFLNAASADIESSTTLPSALVVSHSSLVFAPLKDLKLELRPIRTSTSENYMLWILTAAAMADGDLERSRKFVRFLLDPVQNLKLVQHTKAGATTLRSQEGFERLPEALQSTYFRKFPIDKIKIERDERVRQADDLIEQSVLGASIIAKAVTPVPTPPAAKPIAAKPTVAIAKPVKSPAPDSPPPNINSKATGETNGETSGDTEEAKEPDAEKAKEPSEEPLPAD